MKPRFVPTASQLQCAFLAVLYLGPCTGREMRARLARRRVGGSAVAFFRVIQRLKKSELISAEKIDREPDEYPGKQCRYKLTRAGRREVVAIRAFYGDVAGLPEAAEDVTTSSVAPLRRPASPSTNCGSRADREIPSHRGAHQRSLRETPDGSAGWLWFGQHLPAWQDADVQIVNPQYFSSILRISRRFETRNHRSPIFFVDSNVEIVDSQNSLSILEIFRRSPTFAVDSQLEIVDFQTFLTILKIFRRSSIGS